MAFVTIRAFDIDNFDHRFRDTRNAHVASGLEHHGVAAIEQGIHQHVDFFLFQRLAACDFNQLCRIARDYGEDFLEWHFAATCVGILGVAINASERATCQAYEHARLASVRGFTLDREEDLRDAHGLYVSFPLSPFDIGGEKAHSTTVTDPRCQTQAAIAGRAAAAIEPAIADGYGRWIPSLSVDRTRRVAIVITTSIGWCPNAARYASIRTIP